MATVRNCFQLQDYLPACASSGCVALVPAQGSSPQPLAGASLNKHSASHFLICIFLPTCFLKIHSIAISQAFGGLLFRRQRPCHSCVRPPSCVHHAASRVTFRFRVKAPAGPCGIARNLAGLRCLLFRAAHLPPR